ncbi:YjcZ family sporulation protein [Sporolactobacillus laevolacticus]
MRIMGASEGYGKNSGFALVVVLFILLIIIGATCVY